MVNHSVQLNDGFKVGDATHKVAELRYPKAGDLIDANQESEVPVSTPSGYQLMVSPTLIGAHVLRRQVVRIGDYEGPLTLAELKRLSQTDLNLLQAEAERMDNALAEALVARGRSAAPGHSDQ